MPAGMMERGNIDVNHRPVVWNDDGSPSTIYSATVPLKDGRWALLPTIANGRFLTPNGKKPPEGKSKAARDAAAALEDAAFDQYQKTGEHLGIFKSEPEADAYANRTHAWMPNGGDEKVYLPSYTGESNMPLTRKEYEDARAKGLHLEGGLLVNEHGELATQPVKMIKNQVPNQPPYPLTDKATDQRLYELGRKMYLLDLKAQKPDATAEDRQAASDAQDEYDNAKMKVRMGAK